MPNSPSVPSVHVYGPGLFPPCIPQASEVPGVRAPGSGPATGVVSRVPGASVDAGGQNGSPAGQSGSNLQGRNYCFTTNNPSLLPSDFEAALKSLPHHRYSIFQFEVSSSGTPHYQGYIEFHNNVRPASLNKADPLAHSHAEVRRGTRVEARDYCRDDAKRAVKLNLLSSGTKSRLGALKLKSAGLFASVACGPWEQGAWEAGGSGTRSDLASAAQMAQDTGSLRAVAHAYPSLLVKYPRGMQLLTDMYRPVRRLPPRVILLYGPPECGKTRWVTHHEEPGALYSKAAGHKWWCGYWGQEAVMLDEFKGKDVCPVVQLLQWLDVYPVQVEPKGGNVPLMATRIYITTNYHPAEWYNFDRRWASYGALARRISQVICFQNKLPFVADHEKFFAVATNGPQSTITREWTDNLIDCTPVPFMGPINDPDAMAPRFEESADQRVVFESGSVPVNPQIPFNGYNHVHNHGVGI